MPEKFVQPMQYMSMQENLRKLGDNLKQVRDEYSLGRYDVAIDHLNKIVSFQESVLQRVDMERKNQMESDLLYASVRCMMGRTYDKLGKKEESKREMEKSVDLFFSVWSELEIKTEQHYADYGMALCMTDQREKAIEILQNAESSGLANSESYLLLGTIFLEEIEGIAQKAERYLNKALKLDPGNPMIYRRLAKAFELQGEVVKAATAKKDAEFALAKQKEKAGNYKEALLAIDKALSFAQEDDDLLETRGEILLELGSAEEALSSLQQALNKNERSVYRRLLLGSALTRLERNEEALAEYDRIIKKEQNAPLIFVRVQKAVVLRELDRIDEAIEELLHCLEISPYFPPAHIELGKTFYDLGEIDKALEKAEQALSLESTNSDALILKGKVLLKRGRIEEAEKIFRSLQQKHPDSVEITSEHSDALVLLDRPEEALKAIDEFLTRYMDAKILRSKVDLLIVLKRTSEALQEVDNLLSLEQENADVLLLKGQIILMQGTNYEKSVEVLEKAVSLNPKSQDGFLMLSDSFLSLKRFREALDAANSVLKLNQKNVDALTNKGLALMELREYKSAIESFDKSNGLQPNNIKVLWGRGECLRFLGKFEEAMVDLRRAWKLAPISDIPDKEEMKIKILHSQVLSLLMLNRNDEALEMAEEGSKLDPRNSLILADLAAIYRFKGEYLRAMAYLDESFKYDQLNAMAWTFKAILLIDMAEYQEALNSLEKSINIYQENDPNNEWNLAMKGWITLLLGPEKCQEAKQMFERALAMNPDHPNLIALYGHAHTLRIIKNEKDARDEYRKVIDAVEMLGIMNANILSVLGMCHFYLRQYDEALRLLFDARSFSRNALIIDGSALTIRFQLALALMCSGRHDQALEQYKSDLKLAEEKKNIDYLGPLYVAIFDMQDAEREMPDLKKNKEFQSAKDLLRNAFDKIKAFHELQCPSGIALP